MVSKRGVEGDLFTWVPIHAESLFPVIFLWNRTSHYLEYHPSWGLANCNRRKILFVCVSVSGHSQLWAARQHTPLLHLSASTLCPSSLPPAFPSHTELELISSLPLGLAPKWLPWGFCKRWLQFHSALSCVYKAWKPGLNLLKAPLTKRFTLQTLHSMFYLREAKYLIFVSACFSFVTQESHCWACNYAADLKTFI